MYNILNTRIQLFIHFGMYVHRYIIYLKNVQREIIWYQCFYWKTIQNLHIKRMTIILLSYLYRIVIVLVNTILDNRYIIRIGNNFYVPLYKCNVILCKNVFLFFFYKSRGVLRCNKYTYMLSNNYIVYLYVGRCRGTIDSENRVSSHQRKTVSTRQKHAIVLATA